MDGGLEKSPCNRIPRILHGTALLFGHLIRGSLRQVALKNVPQFRTVNPQKILWLDGGQGLAAWLDVKVVSRFDGGVATAEKHEQAVVAVETRQLRNGF